MPSFNLQLSEEQLNLVATALGNMPYVQVARLVGEIQRQVAEQQSLMTKTPQEDPYGSMPKGSQSAPNGEAVA